jgi:selenide,water dikinase
MLDSPDCSFDRISKDLALVSTIDFFYPLVDDPFEQGRIGAANVLSDLFAAGVTEVRNGLMVLAVSSQMKKKDQKIVTKMMIDGFNEAF